MNTTIAGLAWSHISRSPIFAAKYSLTMRKSSFSNSFNSFSYNSQHLNVEGSTFKNFLNSAILYNSQTVVYDQLYTQRPRSPLLGDTIIIKNAMFIKCIAEVDGGAICHFSPDAGSLDVSHSTFIECQSGPAPGDGGCIFYSGNRSSIGYCCAYRCFCYRDGNFASISIRNHLPNDNFLNTTTVLQCSPDSNVQGWQSVYLGWAKIRIQDFNSTRNNVLLQSASWMMHTMDWDAYAKHNQCASNNGPWIVYFYAKERDGAVIDSCNFINNTATKKGLFCFHIGVTIKNCVILQTNGTIFSQNRPESYALVKNCVLDVPAPTETFLTTIDNVYNPKATEYDFAFLHTAVCHAKRDIQNFINNNQNDNDINKIN